MEFKYFFNMQHINKIDTDILCVIWLPAMLKDTNSSK